MIIKLMRCSPVTSEWSSVLRFPKDLKQGIDLGAVCEFGVELFVSHLRIQLLHSKLSHGPLNF